MSQVESDPIGRIVAAQGEVPDYRPVCVPAFLGLITGLAAPLALLHPVLWSVPLLAAAVCSFALYRLAVSEPMAGRAAAIVGLALAVLFGVWAPVRMLAFEMLLRRDAERFAQVWFTFLSQQEPHKAYQLTLEPAERSPLDETLWNSYRTRTLQRQGLENFVQLPLVRTLMALGDKAVVRRFAVESSRSAKDYSHVTDVYAVSFDDQGRRKTFFVRLQLVRNTSAGAGPLEWRINSSEGGIRPDLTGNSEQP